MRAGDEVAAVLRRNGGVIARRDHPGLRTCFDALLRRNRLVAVLPGVYVEPHRAAEAEVRMRAVLLRHPDALLIRSSAARVSFWPAVGVSRVEVAVRDTVTAAAGFTFCRRRIPPELIVHHDGLRYTAPALTAIDLATLACADAIDIALRTRAATLPEMHEALALTGRRSGNRERRQILLDSRDEPWSAAERKVHRHLRAAGLTGWHSNWPVTVAGRRYYIDIAFPRAKLAVEIDGRLHETLEDLFESDRRRQNALVAAGWRVVRFTWAMLRDHPDEVIATIRRLLAVTPA